MIEGLLALCILLIFGQELQVERKSMSKVFIFQNFGVYHNRHIVPKTESSQTTEDRRTPGFRGTRFIYYPFQMSHQMSHQKHVVELTQNWVLANNQALSVNRGTPDSRGTRFIKNNGHLRRAFATGTRHEMSRQKHMAERNSKSKPFLFQQFGLNNNPGVAPKTGS